MTTGLQHAPDRITKKKNWNTSRDLIGCKAFSQVWTILVLLWKWSLHTRQRRLPAMLKNATHRWVLSPYTIRYTKSTNDIPKHQIKRSDCIGDSQALGFSASEGASTAAKNIIPNHGSLSASGDSNRLMRMHANGGFVSHICSFLFCKFLTLKQITSL